MDGGRGRVIGTLVGALIIGTITNGLDILNVSSYWQQIIKGAIILIAVLADKEGLRKTPKAPESGAWVLIHPTGKTRRRK